MCTFTLERSQEVGVPRERAFELFADPFALEEITPPWLRFRVVTPRPLELQAGTRIEYRLRLHGAPVRWLTEIVVWEPPRRFVDVQLRGPYRLWEHTHTLEPTERGTRISDHVRYALPLGPIGIASERLFVRHDLRRIFDFRQQAVERLLLDR